MGMPRRDAAHLLRRAGFGGSPEEVDRCAAMSRAEAVEWLLDTSAAPPAPPPPELSDPSAGWWERYVALVHQWVERMRTGPCPLQEKMTLFWHGHFCSGLDKVDRFPYMYDQVHLFRTQGMGSFRELTQAMALQPAMLLYLDNDSNTRWGPNENFARELMELFTLGLDQYSQDDVTAAARAWTGHGLTRYLPDGGLRTYEFHPRAHDGGPKTFFGTTKAWDGPDIVDEILRDNPAKKAVAARFVAAKLWSFLAYPGPEAAVLDAVTAPFLASADLDVSVLLRAILNRDELYSEKARTGLLRSPVEYVVASLKALGVPAADGHPEWYLPYLGQELYKPPNVSGWRSNAYWVSTTTFWARAAFADHLKWTISREGSPYDVFADLGDASAAAVATAVFTRLGIDEPSAFSRRALEQWVVAQRAARWQRWADRPYLIQLALLLPEMQMA